MEEEGRSGREGPRIFEKLQNDITRVLTTILMGVTVCTIYGTALATDVAVQVLEHVPHPASLSH